MHLKLRLEPVSCSSGKLGSQHQCIPYSLTHQIFCAYTNRSGVLGGQVRPKHAAFSAGIRAQTTRKRKVFSSREHSLVASPDVDAFPESLRRPNAKVLLIGEGDFSFASALGAVYTEMDLTATSLHSREDAEQRWGAADSLTEMSGRIKSSTRIMHGIDGTVLHESPLAGSRFDCIAFMFPHCGKKGAIHLNRELMHKFFASARLLLSPQGQIEVTVAAGQGGTPADAQHRRESSDSWQLVDMAGDSSLLLTCAEPFNHEGWSERGYRTTGCWRGLGRGTRTQGFRSRGAVVHTFKAEGEGVECIFPSTYQRDVSVWADHWIDSTYDSIRSTELIAAVANQVAAHVGPLGDTVKSISLIEVWRRPADARCSVHLRITYCSAVFGLSQRKVNNIHSDMCLAIPKVLGLAVRRRSDALLL
mmetsp:Transcript_15331/g.29465  ORF Transcript_15331/g.29465 Transcript_15331/m.29465 type:complete len:418 (-) Transcript_15331:340-1593(-)